MLLPRYRVPQKNYQVRRGSIKNEKLLSREIKKNVFGPFIRDDLWLCASFNFFLRPQMEPLQSIKFNTADLPIFCARIIVIF